MYDKLRDELVEAGFNGIDPDSLQAVYDDKVKLSHTAHGQFQMFMSAGRKMFAEAE